MPLKLRRADLQYPNVGWPPDEGHLVVMHGENVVGSLSRVNGGPANNQWMWSITGLYVPPGVMNMHGVEDGKEAAKAAFGSTLRTWLVHVGADDLTDEVLAQHGFGRNCRSRPKKT